ncbi:FG-GAP-like repeat-containing protein [Amycolatopsis sp. NPDC051373]|uniref:FG-GAP-like repeat-containing protein n=1 Tax=Amycolatopsis sp. NPDC051373 TaxID=3155801 RepID=UPI00344DF0F7
MTVPSAQAVSSPGTGNDGFATKITMDGRSCSGALVAPSWVVTAATCFAETPDGGVPVKDTTAIVGRPDLTTSTGHAVKVTTVTTQADRGFALAKLETPISDITPLALGSAAPTAGDSLRVAGFGRTGTEWIPNQLHTATFNVASVGVTEDVLTGDNGVDTCRGDAGAPVVADRGGVATLVGVVTKSWQHSCFGETETRQGTTATRIDDLTSWVRDQVLAATAKGIGHSITVSWNSLPAADNATYRVYGSTSPDVPTDAAHLLATTQSTSYSQGSLPGHQTRYYRVAAATADGFANAPTDVFSATTPAAAHDFTGDGKDDVAAAYDFGSKRTGVYVWPTTATGTGAPALRWDSGAGQFNAAQARWVTGDFNGDGRSDFAAVYDYLNNTANLFFWYGNASGGFDPQGVKWGGSFNATKAKFVSGDFDGDGLTDIGAAYDNGNSDTSFLVWHTTATGVDAPVTDWSSGAGNWVTSRSYWLTGDFNGDGRTDVASFYDYLNNTSNLFVWYSKPDGTFTDRSVKWGGTFSDPKAQFVSGDFDGDGLTDIGAAYDNGNSDTSFLVWRATAAGVDAPVSRWDSGAGGWSITKSHWTTGDLDGDGRTDVVAMYNYGSANTVLYTLHSEAGGTLGALTHHWDSGVGNFDATPAVLF